MSVTTDSLPKTFRTLLAQTIAPAFRKEIAETFFSDKEAQPLAKETFHAVANLRKMRLQAFSQLPKTARIDLFLAALSSPMLENSAMQALQVWYLRKGKDVIAGFLDAWNVPHTDGEIADDAELQPLSAETVDAAVTAMRTKHPVQALIGYLAYTRLAPPEESWSAAVEPALIRLLSEA
jgi:hypothetical protein